jgi:hypothetical protein
MVPSNTLRDNSPPVEKQKIIANRAHIPDAHKGEGTPQGNTERQEEDTFQVTQLELSASSLVTRAKTYNKNRLS